MRARGSEAAFPVLAAVLTLVGLLGLPGAHDAAAQPAVSGGADSGLQRLDSWARGRGWEGVGLLDIEGRASCTGVLIRADLVLTAAHCLLDPATGRRADPRRVEFLAGWRHGRAVARRRGRQAVVHPEFDASAGPSARAVRHDVALLRLESPIPPSHAGAFRAGGAVRAGETVSVVSYGEGRRDAPVRQRSCRVLDSGSGLLALSCDVVRGSSGAPVFALRQGRAWIVSLISSAGEIDGGRLSFGMDISGPLEELLEDLRSGRGVFPEAPAAARRLRAGENGGGAGFRRLRAGEGRASSGARFLKP